MKHDAHWLRKLAYLGARYGPEEFVKWSPPAIGVLLSAVLAGHRDVVLRNLRQIYGKRGWLAEQLDVARTFAEFASCLAESLGQERAQWNDLRFRTTGESSLRALADGQSGFIVLTAHVGAWDLAAQHLQREFGKPVMIAMTRERDASSRDLQDSLRRRNGVTVAHVGADTFEGLALLRHLRTGGVIAVQLDRIAAGSRGLDAKLFEKAFRVPMGPFHLASLASVPLLPVFCARVGRFEYEIVIEPEVRLGRRPTHDELRSSALSVLGGLERFLRRYPTQWFNFEVARDLLSHTDLGGSTMGVER